ncbi:hypothetical protein DFH08DRAFT_820782 [Mycena albidolilacea]|uniref:Uncharacterized protein n=1 Tax=Mycena albidolilacea TaxID=1033008 RepID=A0AAD6ZC22_9AGAR|nr:hypothetical protein DFH08DRAFT_820782 [Mycena albidolilacea]
MRLSKICVFLPLLLLFAWISCDTMLKFPPLLCSDYLCADKTGLLSYCPQYLGPRLNFDIFTEQASDPVLGPQLAAGPSSPQLPPLPMPSPPSPTPVPALIPSSTKPTRKRKSNEVDPANVIHTARPRKALKHDDEI